MQLGADSAEAAGQGDREEAGRLLHLALDAAQQMQIPEARQIEQLIKRKGLGSISVDRFAAIAMTTHSVIATCP